MKYLSNQFPIAPKPKPTGYRLVDISAGKERQIQEVGATSYGLLVHIKKRLKNNQNELKIQTIY